MVSWGVIEGVIAINRKQRWFATFIFVVIYYSCNKIACLDATESHDPVSNIKPRFIDMMFLHDRLYVMKANVCRLTERGQVSVPASIWKALGLRELRER